MKALSLHQPWASLIAQGKKTIETRRWATSYRGPLLICSSGRPVIDGLPAGKALCVVDLVGCRPMTRADEKAACCDLYPGAFAWVLDNRKRVQPFPVQGQQRFFDVDDEQIMFMPGN